MATGRAWFEGSMAARAGISIRTARATERKGWTVGGNREGSWSNWSLLGEGKLCPVNTFFGGHYIPRGSWKYLLCSYSSARATIWPLTLSVFYTVNGVGILGTRILLKGRSDSAVQGRDWDSASLPSSWKGADADVGSLRNTLRVSWV